MYAFDSDKLAKAVTIAVAAVRLVMLLNEGTEGMGYKFLLCIIYSVLSMALCWTLRPIADLVTGKDCMRGWSKRSLWLQNGEAVYE